MQEGSTERTGGGEETKGEGGERQRDCESGRGRDQLTELIILLLGSNHGT